MKKLKMETDIIESLGKNGMCDRFVHGNSYPIKDFILTIAKINEKNRYPYCLTIEPQYTTKIIDGKEIFGIRFRIKKNDR